MSHEAPQKRLGRSKRVGPHGYDVKPSANELRRLPVDLSCHFVTCSRCRSSFGLILFGRMFAHGAFHGPEVHYTSARCMLLQNSGGVGVWMPLAAHSSPEPRVKSLARVCQCESRNLKFAMSPATYSSSGSFLEP